MKRAIFLHDLPLRSAPGRTIFKTKRDENGWMGIGLRPVQPWDVSTFREWSESHESRGEEDFLLYLKKKKSQAVQMTPGSAAGVALMVKGYKQFSLPGQGVIEDKQGDFSYDLGVLATCASPLFSALAACFTSWCSQQNCPETIEKFDEFMSCMGDDIPVSPIMLGLIRRIVQGPQPKEWNDCDLSQSQFSAITSMSNLF